MLDGIFLFGGVGCLGFFVCFLGSFVGAFCRGGLVGFAFFDFFEVFL